MALPVEVVFGHGKLWRLVSHMRKVLYLSALSLVFQKETLSKRDVSGDAISAIVISDNVSR